jgi:hypothetical protein
MKHVVAHRLVNIFHKRFHHTRSNLFSVQIDDGLFVRFVIEWHSANSARVLYLPLAASLSEAFTVIQQALKPIVLNVCLKAQTAQVWKHVDILRETVQT